MKNSLFILTAILLTLGCQATPDYWPTEGWRSATPESQGVSSEILTDLVMEIQANRHPIDYVLVIRNGYIILEAEFYPYSGQEKTNVHSVTKSVTSALIGRLLYDGHLSSLQTPVLDFFPEYQDIPGFDEKSKITIENLLHMADGIQWDEHGRSYSDPQNILNQGYEKDDSLRFYLEQPGIAPPGTTFQYNTAIGDLLLELASRLTEMETPDLLEKSLFSPLGIETYSLFEHSPGFYKGGDALQIKPRDLAKIGFLFLHQGLWEDQRLLSQDFIQASSRPHPYTLTGPSYGYQWWIQDLGFYYAHGSGSQVLVVDPKNNTVAVFLARSSRHDLSERLYSRLLWPHMGSSGTMEEKPLAQEKLQALLTKIKSPEPRTPEPLPPLAHRISGRTYVFEENPMGWESLIFRFGAEESLFELTSTFGTMEFSIGMNNVFRSVFEKEEQVDILSRGRWMSENAFALEIRSPAWRYSLFQRFTFIDEELRLNVSAEGSWSHSMVLNAMATP